MAQAILSGQDEAIALLRAALSTGHVGHAYLFHGPAGVGKTRAALWFARALLCESPRPGGDPCDACAACRASAALRHPDLDLLLPLPTFRTEGRTERQADEARSEARAAAIARYAAEPYFTPTFTRPGVHSVEDLARAKQFLAMTAQREGGRKVLIVKGAEAMTGPAAHAFLKILEEPQPERVLILGARQVRGLLPTIASRCLHVRFRPLPVEFVAKALTEGFGVSRPVARLAAATAQGSLGRAAAPFAAPLDGTGKDAPDEAEFSRLRAAALELFVRPRSAAILTPLRKARLERDRGRFLTTVSLAIHYYRDAIRTKVAGEGTPLAHEDLKREIAADARALPLRTLTGRVRTLEEIAAAVQSNVTVAYAVAAARRRMGLAAAPEPESPRARSGGRTR
ncbi:MAG: ATP-binding protein [Hyphomicrobiales bacterium]